MSFPLRLTEHYYRLASTHPFSKVLLPKPIVPPETPLVNDPLKLEIVSHCWNYAHLLAYQLSSLVLYAPRRVDVTFTVYFSREDQRTVKLLEYFEAKRIPSVRWNFHPLNKERLFRRAIGRNLAARATTADWVWFTDCDQVFHERCLDSLADTLPQQTSVLVFPRHAQRTELLAEDDPLLKSTRLQPRLVEIDPTHFHLVEHEKAIGALQIVRGDVARSIGYCNAVEFFQRPVPRWQKTYEDRTFRHLVGTHGDPIDVPNLYRIEHAVKGRKDRTAMAA